MREKEIRYSFGGEGRGRSVGDDDASFGALDPGRGDPGYWSRFQNRTLALVEPELARRREALDRMTVSEVVTSWSRAVVPVAMVAAAAAVMVLLTEPGDPIPDPGPSVALEDPVVVEGPERPDETLDLAVDGGPIPAVAQTSPDEMPAVVTVAAEAF